MESLGSCISSHRISVFVLFCYCCFGMGNCKVEEVDSDSGSFSKIIFWWIME